MRTARVLGLALLVSFSGFGCSSSPALAAGAPAGTSRSGPGPAPFATPPVLAGTPDIATLVAKVKPSVVNITSVHEVEVRRPDFEGFFPFEFFGPRGTPGGRGGRERAPGHDGDEVIKQQSLGSGFLVDSAGHVVTNAHVVEGADEVRVKLADDREFEAKVRGRDTRLDLAVLELAGAHDLPAASLGSSEALRVGDYVVPIGNPFGLGHTVTMGIVSAKGRVIGAGPYDDFIQTDASINPGNSGGPLFDLHGQVVGIATAINPNGRGIGFAIPIDVVREVLPALLDKGRVPRGKIGVQIQPVEPALAKAVGLDRPRGALLHGVEAGGPGEQAGLRVGDVIVAIDGNEIARAEDLPRAVARHAPGSRHKLEIVRERARQSLEITLGELADDPEPRRERRSR